MEIIVPILCVVALLAAFLIYRWLNRSVWFEQLIRTIFNPGDDAAAISSLLTAEQAARHRAEVNLQASLEQQRAAAEINRVLHR